jgi:hypothetical protein
MRDWRRVVEKETWEVVAMEPAGSGWIKGRMELLGRGLEFVEHNTAHPESISKTPRKPNGLR